MTTARRGKGVGSVVLTRWSPGFFPQLADRTGNFLQLAVSPLFFPLRYSRGKSLSLVCSWSETQWSCGVELRFLWLELTKVMMISSSHDFHLLSLTLSHRFRTEDERKKKKILVALVFISFAPLSGEYQGSGTPRSVRWGVVVEEGTGHIGRK